jgi:chemotaxis response regulator CheB
MPAHDIIVVGFSAGGVEALQVLVRGLLRHLPASVFIAQHGRAPQVRAICLRRQEALREDRRRYSECAASNADW